jgi:hypothetical protein
MAAIRARQRDLDAGGWELDNQHWTHSLLMCMAGLRAIASVTSGDRQAGEWERLADTMLAEAARDGTSTGSRRSQVEWALAIPMPLRAFAGAAVLLVRVATAPVRRRTRGR